MASPLLWMHSLNFSLSLALFFIRYLCGTKHTRIDGISWILCCYYLIMISDSNDRYSLMWSWLHICMSCVWISELDEIDWSNMTTHEHLHQHDTHTQTYNHPCIIYMYKWKWICSTMAGSRQQAVNEISTFVCCDANSQYFATIITRENEQKTWRAVCIYWNKLIFFFVRKESNVRQIPESPTGKQTTITNSMWLLFSSIIIIWRNMRNVTCFRTWQWSTDISSVYLSSI